MELFKSNNFEFSFNVFINDLSFQLSKKKPLSSKKVGEGVKIRGPQSIGYYI